MTIHFLCQVSPYEISHVSNDDCFAALMPCGFLPAGTVNIIPYRRVWRKGEVDRVKLKKSSREAAKQGLRGARTFVAIIGPVCRDK